MSERLRAARSEGRRTLFPKATSTNSGAKGSTADDLRVLQRGAGNQAVQRMLKSGALQPELIVGQPDDKYEQEADRVAEQVMSMPEPSAQDHVESDETEEPDDAVGGVRPGGETMLAALPDPPLLSAPPGTVQLQRKKVLLPPPHQPARPKLPKKVYKPLSALPKNVPISDPTKRAHGIRIKVRGDDVYYYLKGETSPRLIPRPLASGTPPKQVMVRTVSWARTPNEAFRVSFVESKSSLLNFGHYSVTTTGHATFTTTGRRHGTSRRSPKEYVEHFKAGFAKTRNSASFPKSVAGKTHYAGAIRYFHPDSSYSLFLLTNHRIETVENATGKRFHRWPKTVSLSQLKLRGGWGTKSTGGGPRILHFQIASGGQTTIVWQELKGPPQEVKFSLKSKKYPSLKPTSKVVPSSKLIGLKSSLQTKGVEVDERGTSFTERELQTLLTMVQNWKSKISIKKALGHKVSITIDSTFTRSHALAATKSGILFIPGLADIPLDQRLSTLIHEFTHQLYAASGFEGKAKPASSKAKEFATALKGASASGAIDEGSVNVAKKRTNQQWMKALSTDPELNRIWSNLHYRFSIGDPEFSGDIRGLDVADESRYVGGIRGDAAGHGFDNVSEFMASFMASTHLHQAKMVATIKRSKSRRLAALYRDLWNWTNRKLFGLSGKNPY